MKLRKILYVDANNLYGHSISHPLRYDEIKFERDNCLNEILSTPDDKSIGFFSEVDLSYLYNIRQKTKHFPFCLQIKSISKGDFTEYMKRIKPKKYISHKKLICDWVEKEKYLVHYRMLKIYVRHGLTIDKIHEII